MTNNKLPTAVRRLETFERFYATLDEEDRRGLDAKLKRWAGMFPRMGIESAKELFMALVERAG